MYTKCLGFGAIESELLLIDFLKVEFVDDWFCLHIISEMEEN